MIGGTDDALESCIGSMGQIVAPREHDRIQEVLSPRSNDLDAYQRHRPAIIAQQGTLDSERPQVPLRA